MIKLPALLVLALGTVACAKPADPAYLAAIAEAGAAVCACSTLPEAERVACMGAAQKKGTVHPKQGPGGEAPGVYEAALDDASKSAIEAARASAASCEAKIMAP